MFMNCVDDVTCYQTASRLPMWSEEAVIAALVNGWFCCPRHEVRESERKRMCTFVVCLQIFIGSWAKLKDMAEPSSGMRHG